MRWSKFYVYITSVQRNEIITHDKINNVKPCPPRKNFKSQWNNFYCQQKSGMVFESNNDA